MTTWREALTSTGAESQTRVQAQSRAMPNVFNVGMLSNAQFGRECFAIHPAFNREGPGIERVGIGRGTNRVECEAKVSSVLVPVKEAEDIANRKSYQTDVLTVRASIR